MLANDSCYIHKHSVRVAILKPTCFYLCSFLISLAYHRWDTPQRVYYMTMMISSATYFKVNLMYILILYTRKKKGREYPNMYKTSTAFRQQELWSRLIAIRHFLNAWSFHLTSSAIPSSHFSFPFPFPFWACRFHRYLVVTMHKFSRNANRRYCAIVWSIIKLKTWYFNYQYVNYINYLIKC